MHHTFRHGLVDLTEVMDFLRLNVGSYFTVSVQGDANNIVTLRPRLTLDGMANSQPWVARFELVENKAIRLNMATPAQLDPDGTLYNRAIGSLNTEDTTWEQGYWFRRGSLSATSRYSRPFSMLFVADNHGFALALWEHAVVDRLERQLSWVVVQKPVDWETGITVPTSHNPILALAGTFNEAYASIKQMLVRESDVPMPAPAVAAISDTYDRYSVMHKARLKEITEDRDYIVNFPNNFASERFCYDGVFDLIGFANTDLVSANANLPLNVFGGNRVYHSMVSTEADNHGVSVMFRIG